MDFEQFDLIGPANSLESDGTSTIPAAGNPGGPGVPNGGECTTDKIEVTSTVTGFVPTICGDNAGQHCKITYKLFELWLENLIKAHSIYILYLNTLRAAAFDFQYFSFSVHSNGKLWLFRYSYC